MSLLEAPSPFAVAADQLDPPPDPYENDWEGFVRDRLRAFLWSKQREVLRSVLKHQRTAVPACFSSSKSFTAAQLACAWMEIHPPGTAKVVTTASVFGQVRSILWPEIRMAHKRGELRGRVNQTEWHLKADGVENIYGQGLSPRDPVAFQGSHAEYVLVIIDEADGVDPAIWDAAEGLITTKEDRLLAIGNPWDPSGKFAEVCKPGSEFNVVKISAFDTPAFTGEEVPERLHRLLISKDWVEHKERTWGKKDPRYISKVLARFPKDVAGTLIHTIWVEEAQRKKFRNGLPIELGVDIAEGVERDETVIVVRRGKVARLFHASRVTSIPEATGLVANAIRDLGASVAKIDSVGVGAAVYQELRAQGLPVIGLKNNMAPRDTENYSSLGAEIMGGLRDRLRDEDVDLDPDDDVGAGQLISIKGTYNARGQLVLESKDKRRRRKLTSPDRADAYALAFYPVAPGQITDEHLIRSEGQGGMVMEGILDESKVGF